MSQNLVNKIPTLQEMSLTVEVLTAAIATLETRIKALEDSSKGSAKSEKEMTDDHARSVLTGECKDMKHNDAAKKLGLSYGQVYSCRGEYTFRHIHKEMSEKGIKNPWKK